MEIHDHYYHRARREGYRSRAAYKLIEMDERRRLLRPGQRVLDCGCWPGAWLQVAARRVGPGGVVVGVDLRAVEPPLAEPNVRTLVADVLAVEPEALLAAAGGAAGAGFDLILSDMAPHTSGARATDHHASVRLCQRVIDLCPRLLRPGGDLVFKVFEGEAYPDLLRRVAACFERAKGYQPRASREGSPEMYVVAQGFRPATELEGEPAEPRLAAPPRPPAGWGGRKKDQDAQA